MTESLDVDYSTLKSRVGRILGVPDDEMEWTDGQRRDVDEVIRDGLRQYYNPPQVDQLSPHEWSFMHPTQTIKTVEGQRWYDLPPEFAILNAAAAVTFNDPDVGYNALQVTSASHIREALSLEGSTNGVPRMVATRLKDGEGTSPQRSEMGFHPTPDGEYTFAYDYEATPYMVTDERPYPLGGTAHGQGILLSCIAAAELFEFETRGEHYAAFIDKLKSDIAHDARRAPATLGYGGVNRRGGWRDRFGVPRNSSYFNSGTVTYRGVDYS